VSSHPTFGGIWPAVQLGNILLLKMVSNRRAGGSAATRSKLDLLLGPLSVKKKGEGKGEGKGGRKDPSSGLDLRNDSDPFSLRGVIGNLS
jgi:hypothetical protein